MIIGMDEVGRGAWAGPLVVGAVALDEPILGLADSKVIKKLSREELAKIIHEKAAFVGLGWVTAAEVDDLGLTAATTLACQRALEKAPLDSHIIIDGKINYLPDRDNVSTLVDGDAKEPAISAASIVAKVARDNYMAKEAENHPQYGFATNVGYGTRAHMEAIQSQGLTTLHRWSFRPIKDFLDDYERNLD